LYHIRKSGGLFAASLLVSASLLLSACGGDTATNTPVPLAATDTPAAAAPTNTTAAAPTNTTAAAAATDTPAAAAAPTNTEAMAASTPTTAASTGGTGKKLKVGLVTDVGSINDKSFNQSSYEGVVQAQKDLGADIKYLEPKDAKDYSTLINQFVQDKYDVIVTVGFALADATTAAAKASPDVKFIGVDQFQSPTSRGWCSKKTRPAIWQARWQPR
jgi:basic membrane lipoprotein Med (substrate-binding protein (PBP1-ABC) superfamily)